VRWLRSGGLAAVLALAPTAANAVPLPLGHWELLRRDVPATLLPGARVDVPVRIRNRSDRDWSEATRDRLAYHWRYPDGTMAIQEGERTHLPAPLAPGDAVDLVLHVTAPTEPGRYYLQIEPVREQRRWWGMPYLGRDLLIPVEVTGGDLSWSIGQVAPPPPIAPGRRTTIPIRLTNDGDTTWSPSAGDRLSHHILDAEGRRSEGVRTRLPGPVPPHTTVDLTAEILAPSTPGPHLVIWEPVREHVRWYGPPRSGLATTELLVVDTREHIVLDPPPLTIHAQTIADVDILVRNAGDDLPEDHGLHLSYHWRAPDGAILEFEGLRTPLPPLAPGEEALVPTRLRGPDLPGEHLLEWALVREDVGWYPLAEPADTTLKILPPLLAWSLESADWPWTLAAARSETIRLRVRNTGSDTLSPETGDRIGYRWLDDTDQRVPDEGIRTALPRALAPGASTSLDVRVAGPVTPGRYTLEFGLVREHVAWAPAPAAAARSVQVVRRSAQLQLLLLLATLLLLVHARRRRHPLVLRHGPAAFTAAATFTQTLAFADLAGVPLYAGGRALAASAAALPALLVLLAPRRLGPWLALLLALVGATLLLADLLYMQMLGGIVPLQALRGGHQVANIGPSVRAMVTPDHLWLLAAPLAALLLAIGWPARHVPKTSLRAPFLVSLIALTPISFLLALAMAGPLGTRVFSEQQNVGRFGVLGAHLFDGLRTVRDRIARGTLTPAQRQAVTDYFAARPPPPTDANAGVARGDNLLLIQAEAMQGWVLGARVDDQEVTPFLNSLARRSLTYTQLADETAQGMTSDAEYAALNSQLPLGQGAIAFLRADNNFLTLAHVLQGSGYATLSAHPFKKGFWNRAVIHPRYGFDRSLFAEELGPGRVIGWGLADGDFFTRMVPELAALPRPFFAFLVTLSLHHPYDHFPEDLKQLDLGRLEGSNLGNYLHGMHYLDRSLARLFADLAAADLLEHTVVAIYGDHDSRLPLGPDLLRLAGIAETPVASAALSVQLDRIAGVITLPGGQVRGDVSAVGGHIDLAPTLLHYLGVAAPRSFVGRPLLPAPDELGFAVFSDGSAIGLGRVFAAASRGLGPSGARSEISHDGACFEHPGGARLDRHACTDLVERAAAQLRHSRTVADHDLARTLAGP
jgi:phosphoglycerol transferase MdoB-like AlkP superfamily enzyme